MGWVWALHGLGLCVGLGSAWAWAWADVASTGSGNLRGVDRAQGGWEQGRTARPRSTSSS
eukprot:6100690-Alexandrium_andersonii.AAC.1